MVFDHGYKFSSAEYSSQNSYKNSLISANNFASNTLGNLFLYLSTSEINCLSRVGALSFVDSFYRCELSAKRQLRSVSG